MHYVYVIGICITVCFLVVSVVLVSIRNKKLTFTKAQKEAIGQLWETAMESVDVWDFVNKTKIRYAAGNYDKVNKESLQILKDLEKRKTNILDKKQVEHITGEK